MVKGFTLIELLVVVAIIAILAAIAIPNFLQSQTRANVARVQADFHTLAHGLELYRVDHRLYPEGTDNPFKYDEKLASFLGPLAQGYYTIRTRGLSGELAGQDFHSLTTPIAYVTKFFTDPFIKPYGDFLTYCYRPTKDIGKGYILTSFGPDRDLFDAPCREPRGRNPESKPIEHILR